MISIATIVYFIIFTYFQWYAPPIELCKGSITILDTYIKLATFGIKIVYGMYAFKGVDSTIDKLFCIAFVIHSALFFIYNSFLINKESIAYVAILNSKNGCMFFTIAVFVLISSVLVFYKKL
jgi:hypothetical protein